MKKIWTRPADPVVLNITGTERDLTRENQASSQFVWKMAIKIV